MKWLAATAIIACLVAQVASAAEHTKESLAKVKENLAEKKAVIIDVRQPAEWERGHLKDATLWPLADLKRAQTDGTMKEKLAKSLPPDRIIYCHCAKGVRALMAAQILAEMKYDVRPLAAGYDELRDDGFPVVVPDKAR